MAKKYLTLEEAAQELSISKDELVRLRENGEIRGFADRGNWKFKVEDVQTLVRRQQADSDPETPLLSDSEGDLAAAGSASGDESSSSDSDVRLVTDSGIISGSDSQKSGAADDDSDSDIRLGGDSDSDVKLAGAEDENAEGDSDSDVKMVGDDSDSDVKIVSQSDSDSDITLATGDAKSKSADKAGSDITTAPDADETTERDVKMVGSDSDVRLVADETAEGSDSDVQVVDSSTADQKGTDSDIALVGSSDSAVSVDLGEGGEAESALSDESGIALTGDSSMTLASESGISLEGPSDSGISLDLGDEDDEGITLAEDSGIALSSGEGQTSPIMDTAGKEDEGGTQFDIPAVSDESAEFEFDEEETGVFHLEGDESDEQTALLETPDAVFDVDEEESAEFSDELEFDDSFDTGSVAELDVFEEEGGEFEEGFTSGVSHREFAPAVSRAPAVEADWGTGPFVGLLLSTVLLLIVGIVMFDVVRSMWMWNEPTPLASMFLDFFGGFYGS